MPALTLKGKTNAVHNLIRLQLPMILHLKLETRHFWLCANEISIWSTLFTQMPEITFFHVRVLLEIGYAFHNPEINQFSM